MRIRFSHEIPLAAFLVLVQLGIFFLGLGKGVDLSHLCHFDCGWYEGIADQGYLSHIPPLADRGDSNVGFFPFYPFVGAGVHDLTGIPIIDVLPLFSILSMFFFWFINLHLARRLGIPPWIRWVLAGALICYPGSFYLISGYSEGTYLALTAALAYFFARVWREPDRRARSPLSDHAPYFAMGVLSYCLALTRLTGAVFPFALSAVAVLWNGKKGCFKRLSPAIGAGIGLIHWFLFCQLKFGEWDLYFQTVRIGWDKEFAPERIPYLFWKGIRLARISVGFLATHPEWLSLTVVMLTISLTTAGTGWLAGKLRKRRDPRTAVLFAFVLGAWIHVLLTAAGDGGSNDNWVNGIRYCIPALYLLLLGVSPRVGSGRLKRSPATAMLSVLYLALIFWCLELQLCYIPRFVAGKWVS